MSEQQDAGSAETSWSSLIKFVFGLLALVVVLVLFYFKTQAPPDPVAAPFTRIGGETRIETALEASRLWRGAVVNYVVIPASAPERDVWDAAECALRVSKSGPIPLLYEPDRRSPRFATFVRSSRLLGGQKITLSDCRENPYDPMPTDFPCHWSSNASIESTEAFSATWWVLDSDRRVKPDLPSWAPCNGAIASTVVVAAAKAEGDSPDVAVGLVVAARLANLRERDVSILVIPPYLESDLLLEDRLRSETTEVTGGVLLGQTLRIPEETRVKLRAILPARASLDWLEGLQPALTPLEAIVAALLALFGAKQIAEATGLREPGQAGRRVPGAMAGVVALAIIGLVLVGLPLLLPPSRGAVGSNSHMVPFDQLQGARDMLLVLLPLLTTGVGYWIGSIRKAHAERAADQATRVADAERRKVEAILDSSQDPGLMSRAKTAHPEAFGRD